MANNPFGFFPATPGGMGQHLQTAFTSGNLSLQAHSYNDSSSEVEEVDSDPEPQEGPSTKPKKAVVDHGIAFLYTCGSGTSYQLGQGGSVMSQPLPRLVETLKGKNTIKQIAVCVCSGAHFVWIELLLITGGKSSDMGITTQ